MIIVAVLLAFILLGSLLETRSGIREEQSQIPFSTTEAIRQTPQKLAIISSYESCQTSNRKARNLYIAQENLGWQCVSRESTLPQYVTFALDDIYEINKLIMYQTTLPQNEVKDVSIWISTDSTRGDDGRFVKIAQKTLQQTLGSQNEINFAPISTRWIRIQVDSAYNIVGFGLSKVEIYGISTVKNDNCKNIYGSFCIASNFCPQGSSLLPALTCPSSSGICCFPTLPLTQLTGLERMFINNVDSLFSTKLSRNSLPHIGFEEGKIKIFGTLAVGSIESLVFDKSGKFLGRESVDVSKREPRLYGGVRSRYPVCLTLFMDVDNNNKLDRLSVEQFDRDSDVEIILYPNSVSTQKQQEIQQIREGLSGPPSHPTLECYA